MSGLLSSAQLYERDARKSPVLFSSLRSTISLYRKASCSPLKEPVVEDLKKCKFTIAFRGLETNGELSNIFKSQFGFWFTVILSCHHWIPRNRRVPRWWM